jgi:hypothetical protein
MQNHNKYCKSKVEWVLALNGVPINYSTIKYIDDLALPPTPKPNAYDYALFKKFNKRSKRTNGPITGGEIKNDQNSQQSKY